MQPSPVGRRTLVRTGAAAVALCAVLLAGAAVVLGHGNGQVGAWKALAMTVVWVVPGLLVARDRPRLPLGWLALGQALLFAAVALGSQRALSAAAGGSSAGIGWGIWVADRAGALLAVGLGLLLVLLPDGRLPSSRWRPVVGTVVGLQLLLIALFATAAGPAAGPDSSLPAAVRGVPNPVGVLPAAVGAAVEGWDVVALQLPLLLCLVAIVVRLRRAGPDERARVVTVLLAAATCILVVVLGHAWLPTVTDVLDVAASALLAAALTATVLGRRPRSVAALVREALVLTVLAALVGALTAGIAAAWGTELSVVGTGVTVGVLALLAHPLRSRFSRRVDRLLHGDLADPYRALQRLADRTHRAPTLAGVLEGAATSAQASLRVTWAAAVAGGEGGESGTRPPDGHEVSVPLRSGAEVLGALTVATGAGRRLTADERRLLDDLGRHGGVAVQAVVLADRLREGRQRLVLAREEERRRLRRDLHDDVGPTLAGLAMQLGVVRALVEDDPRAAADRLLVLQDAARTALTTLRRTAHGLRPPALDELGLGGALERLATSLGLDLHLDAPRELRLPAAVEVAAYRIAAEALHNVARHAGTAAAGLRLTRQDGDLVLVVRDRGAGRRAEAPAGVGLLAMRERADELGGSVHVDSGAGWGTTVTARLPAGPSVAAEVVA